MELQLVVKNIFQPTNAYLIRLYIAKRAPKKEWALRKGSIATWDWGIGEGLSKSGTLKLTLKSKKKPDIKNVGKRSFHRDGTACMTEYACPGRAGS